MKLYHIKLSSIICGLLFLTAGVLLFAFNANPPLLDVKYKTVVFSLPMLVVATGFVCLFSRSKWIFGMILMLTGGFFILPKLQIEGLDFIANNGWAIVLIIIGILVICNTIWKRRIHWHTKWEWSDKECHTHSRHRENHKSDSGHIDFNCVFTGGKKKLDTKNFRGGEINNVFGGMELDLSEAEMPEGIHYLEINSVFGGVVIYAPVEWKIELRQTSQVFGNFVDNRPKPGFEVDEKRVLVIEANAVFGGGEIKCK